MTLVSLLKSVLGIGSDADSTDRSRNGDGPNTENEAAVKGTDEPAAAGTDAAASTGSVTEEPPEGKPDEDDPVESAAEPAEAAGPQSQVEEDAAAEVEPDDEETTGEQEDAEGSASITEEPPGDEVATEPAEAAGPADVEPEDAGPELTDVSGIGPAYAKRLEDAGIDSVTELTEADAEELADETGVSEKRIGRWKENAEDV